MKLNDVLLDHMTKHMIALCKKKLDLTSTPKINMIHNKHTIEGGTSFGEFNGKTIDVVALGRHPMDVMRTLAHELVHLKQREAGLPMDGSDGSPIENQANAIAGVIMREFGKMYPEYFLDTLD